MTAPGPFSPACERNKEPILAVLTQLWSGPATILELGSGTGQHAVHFPAHLPALRWQPTDREENLAGIRAWVDSAGLPNLAPPLRLDVTEAWPIARADGVFSANTAHIMPWAAVQAMFAGVGRVLAPRGYFCLYGPFNIDGQYTGPGNRRFDAELRARDAAMGIRDLEALAALAAANGLEQMQCHLMPADNRLLIWRRAAGG